MRKESASYLVLFCALLVATKKRVMLKQAIADAPLTGNARLLGTMLWQQQASRE